MIKFFSLSVFFSLFVAISTAQTQQGVVYRYNGKDAKTPLGNVTITYDSNQRTTISNEKDGTFTLTLVGRKMGDRIGKVVVKKREMMVFNQQAVNEWSIRKEPLRLILCNADEFERQKENLINIGRREAKKKYDQQKAALEAKLNASLIKATEYEAALDKAYEELEKLQDNLGVYADLFARIDLSEVSNEEQRILDMVLDGKMEEALEAYRQLNLIDKLSTEASSYQALTVAAKRIEEEQAHKKDNIKELCDAVKRQVSTLKLAWNKKKETEQLLVSLLETLTPIYKEQPDEFRPQVAWVHLQLGEIAPKKKENIEYLSSAVEEYTVLSSSLPDYYLPNLAKAQYLLGYELFYWDKKDADVYLLDAINNYTKLCSQNPKDYLLLLADAKCILGKELDRRSRLDKTMWNDRDLDYCLNLVSYVDPDHYEKHIKALQRIAIEKLGENGQKGKEYLLSALDDYYSVYEKIIDERSKKNEFLRIKIIPTLKSLALDSRGRYEYDLAEQLYLKALKSTLLLQEHETLPSFYDSDIWKIKEDLWKTRKQIRRYRRVEGYEESLKEFLRHQAQIEDELSLPEELESEKMTFSRFGGRGGRNLSDEKFLKTSTEGILLELGTYYLMQGNLKKAESCFERVYQDSKSGKYVARYGISELALAYANKKDFEKATQLADKLYTNSHGQETYYYTKSMILLMQGDEKGALEMKNYHNRLYNGLSSYNGYYYVLMKAFYQRNPNAYLPGFAAVQNNVGVDFSKHGYYEMALSFYEESKKSYMILYKRETEEGPKRTEYFDGVSSELHNIGLVYYNHREYEKAEKVFVEVEGRELTKKKLTNRLVTTQRIRYLIFKERGDKEKSLEYLRKAFENYVTYYSYPDFQIKKQINQLYSDLDNYCKELFTASVQASQDKKYRKAEEGFLLLTDIYEQFIRLHYKYESELAIAFNRLSYIYAKQNNITMALNIIEKAIAVKPEDANYYDSKGEFLLMSGDEKGALEMWKKVIEHDPDYLSKTDGGTPLYKQLKKKGLLD